MSGRQPSQYPTDRLIRDLLDGDRRATPDDMAQIVERMATAPFNPSVVPVRVEHRGLGYQGRTLGARADSLTYHLTQRVVVEHQWSDGTIASQYVADLQRAVRSDATRLAIYRRRGGDLAATVTPTDQVVPAARRGARSLPLLLVVYSVDWGMIVSGYQCSALATTGVPEEARWLK